MSTLSRTSVGPAPTESVSIAAPHRPRSRWGVYALWLVLGLGALLMMLPFYWTIVTAFKTRSETLAFPPTWWPQNPTLDNWRTLNNLGIGSFPVFFRNSLFVTLVITTIALFTSSMVGYIFAKMTFWGRNALFWFVLGMIMIPFTISIVPLYALMARLDWTNNYLSLIVPFSFDAFGIFLMRQFMASIPDELIDAARIDGAGEFGIFFRIILPLSTAALSALGIFVFMYQWNNFLWPLVMINDADLYTLPLGLSQLRGRVGTDIGATAAGAVVAVVPVLIVYFIAQKQFVEGIALSGLKG